MNDINNIEATLKYGQTLTSVKFRIGKFFSTMSIVLSIILLFIVGIYLCSAELTKVEIGIVCGAVVFCLIVTIIVTYCYNRAQKRYLEIEKWLQDAIECRASIKGIDVEDKKYQPYQIEVEFDYKGKKMKKVSNRFNLILDGYPKVFARYHNKNVNILYSEKYDEAMILKK